MKPFTRVLVAVLVAALVGAGAFVAWGLTPLGPGDDALAALDSNPNVSVRESGDCLVFTPTAGDPVTAGFITGERGFVKDCDLDAGTGQSLGGHRAGRPGTYDSDVCLQCSASPLLSPLYHSLLDLLDLLP